MANNAAADPPFKASRRPSGNGAKSLAVGQRYAASINRSRRNLASCKGLRSISQHA
jgi:hypothetical protein